MTKRLKLQKYRLQLQQARKQIIAKMHRVTADGRDASLWAETNDSADMALSSYTKELLYKLSDVERSQFVEIEAALMRLRDGIFGQCIDCGSEVPARRLEVVPWASRCTVCQEAFEQIKEEQEQREAEEVANL